MRSDELLSILLPAGKAIDSALAIMPERSEVSVAADGEEFAYNGEKPIGGVATGVSIAETLIVVMGGVVEAVSGDVIVLLNDLSEILTEVGDGEIGTRAWVTHFSAKRDSSKVSFTEAAQTIAAALAV